MRMSPDSRSPVSWPSKPSTAAAGTISQTARGGFRLLTKSSSDAAPRAPSAETSLTRAASRSSTTHSCPLCSKRRTRLAPMRPSPTMPSCMSDGPSHQFRQLAQASRHVRPEMDAEGPPPAVRQHLEIAARLGGLHRAERVRLARDREIVGIVAGDLQEHAAVRPALVGLSGGVQEARSEAETGGHLLPVAHRVPDGLQGALMRLIHFDVAQEREVIAGRQAAQVRLHVAGKRLVSTCQAFQIGGVLLIREELDAIGFQDGRFGGEASDIAVTDD